MRFDVLTLFPEMFAPVKESILGRALDNNLIELNLINFREFSTDKSKHVDDTPYGGGAGMVIKPEPVYDAYKSIVEGLENKPKVIYLSPKGKVFNQQIARELAKENHLILLCGHYEGIDQRVIDEIVDDEISIGDYVLTGGEIPACILTDCVARLCDGVLCYLDRILYTLFCIDRHSYLLSENLQLVYRCRTEVVAGCKEDLHSSLALDVEGELA